MLIMFARPSGTFGTQKLNVMVSIQPTIPETMTARRMAIGPRMAASCVSSDMCVVPS